MSTTNPITPIVNQPFLYVNGMQLSVASNTTLTVQAGACRDSTNEIDINVGGYYGATPVASTINTAVNGLNGLDQGTLAASTVYYVYAIADQAGFNPSGYILSLNASNPLMPTGVFPSGYSSWRKVGTAITNSSIHFFVIYQIGNNNQRTYFYDAPPTALSAGASTTAAVVNLTNYVPITGVSNSDVVNREVILAASFVPNTAGDVANVFPSGSSSSTLPTITGQVTTVAITQQLFVNAVNVSGEMEVQYKVTSGSDALTLLVYGFVENL